MPQSMKNFPNNTHQKLIAQIAPHVRTSAWATAVAQGSCREPQSKWPQTSALQFLHNAAMGVLTKKILLGVSSPVESEPPSFFGGTVAQHFAWLPSWHFCFSALLLWKVHQLVHKGCYNMQQDGTVFLFRGGSMQQGFKHTSKAGQG